MKPWICYSNFLTCDPGANEHLLRYFKTGFNADVRGLAGHAFFSCEQCRPASYIFAVFSTSPDPHVTCYAISKASYDEFARDTSPTSKPTPEMLYLLKDPNGNSLNSTWRPPRT